MSISLSDALEDVELEDGRTYCCEVHGRRVEVRVLSDSPTARSSTGLTADDVMLDPWCELPGPTSMGTLQSVLVESLPIDIPEIPASEESA
jgi:hypothetical protein